MSVLVSVTQCKCNRNLQWQSVDKDEMHEHMCPFRKEIREKEPHLATATSRKQHATRDGESHKQLVKLTRLPNCSVGLHSLQLKYVTECLRSHELLASNAFTLLYTCTEQSKRNYVNWHHRLCVAHAQTHQIDKFKRQWENLGKWMHRIRTN